MSSFMAVVMFFTTVVHPVPGFAQNFAATWLSRPVSRSVTVTIPAEKWQRVARVRAVGTEQMSIEYASGPRWIVLGQMAGALVPGLTAAQMSEVMHVPQRESTTVFARYVPQQAELVINALKIEKGLDGYVYLYTTFFSPYHGDHWAASRAFLTGSERQDVDRAGRNPFDRFKAADRSDPRFVNIGWDGAMVAVGFAMKYFRAPYSVLSAQNLRMAESRTSSGGLLTRKTTVKVDGYALPTWFGSPQKTENKAR